MSTHQEYWDACLIMAWRNFENYGDAVEKFKSITGISPHEIDPPLLRIPDFCPYSTSIRNMTFAYLTAMNNYSQPQNNNLQPINNYSQPQNNNLQPINNYSQPQNNNLQPINNLS